MNAPNLEMESFVPMTTEHQSDAPQISGIASVVIPVTDQSRALTFYRDVLGCDTREDATYGAGIRWLEVGLPGSPTTLALVPPRDGMWESVGIDSRVTLFSEDVDADHAALCKRGVDADPAVLRLGPGVPAMFRFRDPDGNTLQVVQRT
jgi:catechol 2,3-dioxygenase-like lactoylglutathione lyase family enzyme